MIKKISINNFRNIKHLEVELTEGINTIVAPNGTGKSNFLEAIYYTITGESFRNITTIVDLIGPEIDFATVELLLNDESLVQSIVRKTKIGGRKICKLNGKLISNLEIINRYPVLYFTPSSINLIDGEPSIRRIDIDNFLNVFYKNYKDTMIKYKNVLKSRNKILQQTAKNSIQQINDNLEFWNSKLIEFGSEIIFYRIEFTKLVNELINNSDINNIGKLIREKLKINNQIFLSYKTFLHNTSDTVAIHVIKETFKENIEKNFQKEVILEQTLYGPHRDDFEFNFENKNLKFFGSRGQQRLGVIFFKILQAEIYYRVFQKYPFLLLDDLLSELDHENSEIVLKLLLDKKVNFIITSCREISVLQTKNYNTINLKHIN